VQQKRLDDGPPTNSNHSQVAEPASRSPLSQVEGLRRSSITILDEVSTASERHLIYEPNACDSELDQQV
jgi:hypothetical protein